MVDAGDGLLKVRVAGVSIKEVLMVVIPMIAYIVSGVYAFGVLEGKVGSFNTYVDGKIELLQQVQDTNTRVDASHALAAGHVGTKEAITSMEKKQAVMADRSIRIQEDIKENRALLEDISRSIQQMRRGN